MQSHLLIVLIMFIITTTNRCVGDKASSCELRMILGLPSCAEDKQQISKNISYSFCNIPSRYIDGVKETMGCDSLQKYNPTCSRNITVAYTDLPPYIKKYKDGTVHGIVIKILEKIILERCCLGCNQFQTSKGEKKFDRILIKQFNASTRSDILLSVYGNEIATFALPYLPLLELKQISIIGKKQTVSPQKYMSHLVNSILKTWPLLLMALILAICAGAIVWLLDTWVNKNQFPRRFPNGPYEGFWWAFVSMTTVGYGDRTPTSPAARLFAVLWILTGITIFNMFTASLTSALSEKVMETVKYSLHGKNVGVLDFVPNINSSIRSHFGNPKGCESQGELMKVLTNGNVDAIAMETPMAKWFLESNKEELTDYAILLTLQIEQKASIGVSTQDDTILKMIETFTNRTHVYHLTGFDEHTYLNMQSSDGRKENSSTFTASHPSFILTVSIAAAITILALFLGHLINKRSKKNKQKAKTVEGTAGGEYKTVQLKNQNKEQSY